jgi:hypothetical protein
MGFILIKLFVKVVFKAVKLAMEVPIINAFLVNKISYSQILR